MRKSINIKAWAMETADHALSKSLFLERGNDNGNIPFCVLPEGIILSKVEKEEVDKINEAIEKGL